MILGIVEGQYRRGFRKPVTLEDTNADIGEPARCVEPQRCASGDIIAHPAAEGLLDFLEDQAIGQAPAERGGRFTAQNLVAVAVAGGERPVKELFDCGFVAARCCTTSRIFS